jgi:SH3-like domain-containing protein
MVDLAEDDGDVPDEAVFTYALKPGAPEDIVEKFKRWKRIFEWEARHIKEY